ncbi:MAG TPA: Sua5 family C-terminal domain-containing protein, partial [Dongiaceae bacterium]|nr:Sua5 family C-terminal domain-containing protein [Dongiaceae bacterium]
QVGIESTVLDLTHTPPLVLRPGIIHEESLAAVTGGNESLTPGPATATLRSPGLLKKHYSPKARLVVLDWQNEADLHQRLNALGLSSGTGHIIAHTRIPAGDGFGGVSVIPHDAEAFARAIYAELHRCDEAGVAWIGVEALPAAPEWRAIADRLNRAAAP